ncbi:hypothetical protein [Streptacidiphilus cavernicola]|uniref:Uncharacterized protein n=1 Tax=Streptacidiphilus cavernicola TaxID=3342716 RepID=A0ABV6W244_9ACTN
MPTPDLLHLISRAERGVLSPGEATLLRAGVQRLALERQVFRAELIRRHDEIVRLAAAPRPQPVPCPLWQAPFATTKDPS